MKNVYPILILLLLINVVDAQEYNYARISVLYGSDIPFYFNSLEKYRNGIEIGDGTILGITLADSTVTGTSLEGFDLNVRTFNAATLIRGSANNLDLNRIRLKAENYIGLFDGTSFGYQDLSSVWNTLFSYTNLSFTDLNWSNHQISISYDCGIPVSQGGNGTLLGEEADYYTVEIELEIVPTGIGF